MAHTRRRRDLRRLSDVPHRRHFRRAAISPSRTACRSSSRRRSARATSASSRTTGSSSTSSGSRSSPACRRRWRSSPRTGRTARSSARCAIMPAPARPRSRPRSRGRSRSLIGVRVLLTYGATEYTQNVTQAPRDGDPKYGSPGIRLPYTQIKTVELDGDSDQARMRRRRDRRGRGEGPERHARAISSRNTTRASSRRDGWFNSGDLGRFDADGYLWLTGRAKDVIIRGGHNIDPSVIEETLLKHPRCAAGGGRQQARRLCRRIADRLCAARAGRKASAERARATSPSAHIPERAAAPKEIVILETMPLTDVQKPAKVELRRDAARRAFRDVLADVARWQALGRHGGRSRQGQRGGDQRAPAPARARRDVEDRIHERMKAFAIAYMRANGWPDVRQRPA